MNKEKLNEILANCKSLSDIAKFIFGKENYTNREKCKKIMEDNGIDWKKWLKIKNEKPKRYCQYCGKDITDTASENKFCNQSCAAKYNNSIRAEKRYCLYCGDIIISDKKSKQFCSSHCKSEYEYKKYIEDWMKKEVDGTSGPSHISKHLKRYLQEKYDNRCQLCGWNNVNEFTGKVPLQVHHIDGDFTNNCEENLQLLCPNCHSLTNNFMGLNKKSTRVDKRKKNVKDEIKEDLNKDITEVSRCIVCGKKLSETQTTYCSIKCMKRDRMKHITKEEILEVFENHPGISYEKASKKLDISKTTLTKKCHEFGIIDTIRQLRYKK